MLKIIFNEYNEFCFCSKKCGFAFKLYPTVLKYFQSSYVLKKRGWHCILVHTATKSTITCNIFQKPCKSKGSVTLQKLE
jgi:hypothetical protein